MAAGRPNFVWTEEIEDEILDKIMEGRVPAEFLGDDRESHLPGVTTLYKHLRDDEKFAKKYTRAKEFQADIEFDEIREIADDASNDWMERNDPNNPGWQLNHDHVQRSRLRIDARKWRASKMAPKKYGDKIEATLQNPDGSALNLLNQVGGKFAPKRIDESAS